MSDTHRTRIYKKLIIKETEDLIEIWRGGDTDEWNEEVFEIVKEILVERLGYLPPQSNEVRGLQILKEVKKLLDQNRLNEALSDCELAIQMDPTSPIAYNYRGEIQEEMGNLEKAITSYQSAIQLDPEKEEAWENLLVIELELEEEFGKSSTKHHLDWALEYAQSDEIEKSIQECELAMATMPSIARAYNYLGMIFQTSDQLEPAIESYLKAIQYNPRFYPARENLANAKVFWEEEQYLQVRNMVLNQKNDRHRKISEIKDAPVSETVVDENPIPGWMFLDATAFMVTGWPGHRSRPGRSGYDPLDRDFEEAHMKGLIFRKLITGKFRTRDPIYLIAMICMGVLYSSFGVLPFALLGWYTTLIGIFAIPYFIIGLALWINVYLSLRVGITGETEDHGYTFF